MGVETEIKLTIREQDVDILTEKLIRTGTGAMARRAVQESFFFDGESGQLSAAGISARLRKVVPLQYGEGWWEVTLKGKSIKLSSAVSRDEFEHRISTPIAQQIINNNGKGLVKYLPECYIKQTSLTLLDGKELQYRDGFGNIRCTVGPVTLNEVSNLFIEIDKTTFTNGTKYLCDAELECEVSNTEDIERVLPTLKNLITTTCNYQPRSSVGKRRRMANFRSSKLAPDMHNIMLENRTHWIPDCDAKSCGACESEFTLWRRRHHCRSCGRVFCNACSAEKRSLSHLGYEEEVRCCGACAKIEDNRIESIGCHDYYENIATPEEDTRSPNSSTSYNRDSSTDSTNDDSTEDDIESQSDCEEPERSRSVPISFSQSADDESNSHYSHRMSNRRSRRMQITQAECGVTVWSVSLSSRTPKKECCSYSKYPQQPASNTSDAASSTKRVTFSVP